MTVSQGAAGYVAIEQVSGTLAGNAGSFALQYYGLMNKESNRLTLEVVPGSGTRELSGLIGSLQIRLEDGHHFYDFDYDVDID
jgi:hypothetical protein